MAGDRHRVTSVDADLSAGIPAHHVVATTRVDRVMQGSIAALVIAEVIVVGLQVIGRHIFRHPFPWTEEIARLLLGWLMCAGGIWALRHNRHPRVTVLLRRFTQSQRQAIDRGLRLVLAVFFLCLVVPAWRLTVASAAERLPASGVSGAAVSAVLSRRVDAHARRTAA